MVRVSMVKIYGGDLASPQNCCTFALRVRPAPAELPQARNGARVGGRSGAIPAFFVFPSLPHSGATLIIRSTAFIRLCTSSK